MATPTAARRSKGWRCGIERAPGDGRPAAADPPPAARCTRHAVPAGRHRLDDPAACGAPGALVPGAGRADPGRAGAAGRHRRGTAQPLDAAGGAGAGGVADLPRRTHPARQGRRRDDARRADGAEDAGAARAARRHGRLHARLLPRADELPVFAVAVHGAGDADLGLGADDGAGARAHAGGHAADPGRWHGRGTCGLDGRADHGRAVPAVPAHRATVGPAAGRRRPHRAVGHAWSSAAWPTSPTTIRWRCASASPTGRRRRRAFTCAGRCWATSTAASGHAGGRPSPARPGWAPSSNCWAGRCATR